MESTELAEFIKEFGIVVTKRRRELGMSQADLAKAAGIHRTYVSDVENGKRNFSLGTLCTLAESLGVTVQAIVEKSTSASESDKN